MTPELQVKIDRIKELLAKTTPGPWETDSDRPIGYHILAPVDYPIEYIAWSCPMPGAVGIEQRRANQEYIAAVNPVVMQEIIAELKEKQAIEQKAFQALGGHCISTDKEEDLPKRISDLVQKYNTQLHEIATLNERITFYEENFVRK